MKSDIVSAVWIVLVAVVGIFVLRTLGGLMAKSEGGLIKTLGESTLMITG